MKRPACLPFLVAIGLTMAVSAQAADIAPPPKPDATVTVEVIPGDVPQCRTKEKDIKDAASKPAEKVRDYRNCFKNHSGTVKTRK